MACSSSRWRCAIAAATASRSPRSAHLPSWRSASVTPDTAETTTSTRPPSRRRLSIRLRIRPQDAALATLVPPNFITIHGASPASDAATVAVTETHEYETDGHRWYPD